MMMSNITNNHFICITDYLISDLVETNPRRFIHRTSCGICQDEVREQDVCSSSELVNQVAHSIQIAVRSFQALSKRRLETLQPLLQHPVPPAAWGRWRPQTCSLKGFLGSGLLLLQDTDELMGVGVAVPDGTVKLVMPPLHPVVCAN